MYAEGESQVICGRQHSVQLVPIAFCDREFEVSTKLAENKDGCT